MIRVISLEIIDHEDEGTLEVVEFISASECAIFNYEEDALRFAKGRDDLILVNTDTGEVLNQCEPLLEIRRTKGVK